jgi:hypothetical protein
VLSSWRDRGKEPLPEPNKPQPQQLPPPPPPYQREWQPAAQVVVTPVQVTPRSIRKSRQLQITYPSKRPILYHRKSRSRMQASSPPIPIPTTSSTTPTTCFPAPQPEFNLGHNQEDQVEQTPLEDKVSLLFYLDLSS